MEWRDAFSVGIDEIDKQHRMLLDHFTLIEDAIGLGESWSDVHFPLVQLREFARLHFAVEESLMRMSGYPGTAEHITSHHKFFERLQELEQKSLQTDVTTEMTDFLRNWLVGHIMHADKGYARHIAEGGGSISVRSAALVEPSA